MALSTFQIKSGTVRYGNTSTRIDLALVSKYGSLVTLWDISQSKNLQDEFGITVVKKNSRPGVFGVASGKSGMMTDWGIIQKSTSQVSMVLTVINTSKGKSATKSILMTSSTKSSISILEIRSLSQKRKGNKLVVDVDYQNIMSGMFDVLDMDSIGDIDLPEHIANNIDPDHDFFRHRIVRQGTAGKVNVEKRKGRGRRLELVK